jgi:ATP/ADP translocase/HEAT repeat protein
MAAMDDLEKSAGGALERILKVRPGERRHAGLLFLMLFAASGTFVLGRTLRDTLFLSRVQLSVLPWMFVLYGLVSFAVAMLYGRYADRIPTSRMLYTTSALGISTYLGAWWLVRQQVAWIYPVFYIWAELIPNLLFLQFWTLAASLDAPRDARRLNTTVAAARPLGTIFFGFFIGSLIPLIGTIRIFFVLVILMALLACCVYLLRHEPRQDDLRTAKRASGGETGRSPVPQAYFRSLSLLILIMYVTLTLGDFQFKAIAGFTYSEDSLARFFSLFYGIVGVLAMAFQFLITPRILSTLGVGSALTVMPGVFGTASLILLGWPGLAAACVMKFSDNGLQFTLHDTTMQSLYAPFPARNRARIRALLDGAIKPLSYGAGGLLLVLMHTAGVDIRRMSFVTVMFAVIWQCLVPLVRRGYLRSLETGLAGPMAAQMFEEPFVLGAAERQILVQAMQSPDPMRAMIALEQLQGESSPEFRDALAGLLTRQDGALRARALQLLDAMEDPARIQDFTAAARDPNAMVRSAAVTALARVVGNEQPEIIYPFLADSSEEVRIAALSGLIRHGSLEGTTRAGQLLLRLESSPEPGDRREACLVLGKLGRISFLSLNRLLRDSSPAVVRAAMRAAAGTADPRLVPAMISALYEPGSSKAVLAALVAVGVPAIRFMDGAMRDPVLPRAVRLELPRALGLIPAEESYAALCNHQEDPDSHFRLRVYAALGRLRKRLGRPPLPVELLEVRIRREVLEACGNILGWHKCSQRFATQLLQEEMEFRMRRADRRILRLLELTYDLQEVSVILDALDDPNRRSDALEALDALLDPRLRRLILPLLENRTAPEQLPFGDPDLCVLPAMEFVLLQAYHPNPYVALLALDALSAAGEKATIPAAERALAHRDPLVREAGLRALARLAPGSIPREMTSDPDPSVRRWAQVLIDRVQRIQQESTPLSQEDPMFGTVEKILFLKSTPLFSGLSGEDLAPLARVAEFLTVYPGDFVFTAGVQSDHFYVVVSGQVSIQDRGRELRRVGPQETLGELAVLDREPLSTSARALQTTELLRIGADEFFEILHEQPEIAEALLRIMAGQVRQAHKQLMEQAEALEKTGPHPAGPGYRRGTENANQG